MTVTADFFGGGVSERVWDMYYDGTVPAADLERVSDAIREYKARWVRQQRRPS